MIASTAFIRAAFRRDTAVTVFRPRLAVPKYSAAFRYLIMKEMQLVDRCRLQAQGKW